MATTLLPLHYVTKYLDVQLAIPFIKWHLEQKLYDEKWLKMQLLALYEKTDMVERCKELRREVRGSQCQVDDLEKKKQNLKKRMKSFEDLDIVKLMKDGKSFAKLKESEQFTLEGLEEKHGVKKEDVDMLYAYAKTTLEVGKFADASMALGAICKLRPIKEKGRVSDAAWGYLLSLILTGNSGEALAMLKNLNEAIDKLEELKEAHAPLVLQYRAWVVHWAMFVIFQCDNVSNQILQFFFPRESHNKRRNMLLNVVQLTCPWILRYLCAAVLMQQNKWRERRRVATHVKEEKTNDPVVRLLLALCDDYDPQAAKELIEECGDALEKDFFFAGGLDVLKGTRTDKNEEGEGKEEKVTGPPRRRPLVAMFVKCARQQVFRTFCLTHREIDMRKLQDDFNMEFEELEKWTVDLIQAERNYLLNDVKIDTEKGRAIMDVKQPSIYERIMTKTKDLAHRTYDISKQLTGE